MFSTMYGFGFTRKPVMGTRLIVSAPPAIMTSAPLAMMRSAAMAMVCKPLEQKRLTVWPETSTGSPARNAIDRAKFSPCAPSGMAQPMMTSSISAGLSDGALRRMS